QFDRRSRSRAEVIVGRAHVEMKFAVAVLITDIAVKPADIGCRKIPEPVIMQSFERAIDGTMVVLLARLRRALDASERTAPGIDLGALTFEAVLHMPIAPAAQRLHPHARFP